MTNSDAEQEEYDASVNDEGDGILPAGDLIEGDAFEFGDDVGFGDLGGFGDGDGGFGGFGDAGDRSGVKDSNDWRYEGNPIKTFFFSPLHLVRYVFTDITEDTPKKEEWKDILKVLNVINNIAIVTAIIIMAIGLKTPQSSPLFQLIAGAVMYTLTTLILVFVYKEDTALIKFLRNIFRKLFKNGEESLESENDDMFDMLAESDDDVEFSSDGSGFSFGALGDLEETESEFGDDDEEEYEIDDSEDDDEDEPYNVLRDSPISTGSDEDFGNDLLEVFAKNSKNFGKEIGNRLDIIKSFSDYLIQNSRNFGTWKKPRERGIEYNNISYALYKSFVSINNRFGQAESEDKMYVVDIKKSPLLYRIELSLPNYFSEKKLQSNVKVIEDILKESEDDTNVSVLISTFQGNYVIKLLRLDSKELVSFGDILRFKDDVKGYVALDMIADDDYGLPLLLGLQNNENPYVLDMEANTSGVIVGGSGSGKSWTTFEMMMNFIVTNDYNNVNFIVLDQKNAPFWNTFAKLPHVLGYHHDPQDYLTILQEVEEERKRRQVFLQEVGSEDMRGYRKRLRKQGKYDKLKEVPLMFLVVDEITSTMLQMKETDEELFKSISSLLGQISAQGRSAGIRILSIGQRSTYDSIPKILMANSSFKFGMKMEVQNDFNTMFGDEVQKYKTPDTIGMGLSKTNGVTTLQMIKTLTVGGNSDEQMMMLIRAMAFEWQRRAYGVDNVRDMPSMYNFKHAYNRDRFYDKSIKEMQEGRILDPTIINEGYEVIFPSDENKEEGYKIKQAQERMKAEEEQKKRQEQLEKEKKAEQTEWVDDIMPDVFSGEEEESTFDSFTDETDETEELAETDTNTEFTGYENYQETEEYQNPLQIGDFTGNGEKQETEKEELVEEESSLSWDDFDSDSDEEGFFMFDEDDDDEEIDSKTEYETSKQDTSNEQETNHFNSLENENTLDRNESKNIENVEQSETGEINYIEDDGNDVGSHGELSLEDLINGGEDERNIIENDSEDFSEVVGEVSETPPEIAKNMLKTSDFTDKGTTSQEVHQTPHTNETVPLMDVLAYGKNEIEKEKAEEQAQKEKQREREIKEQQEKERKQKEYDEKIKEQERRLRELEERNKELERIQQEKELKEKEAKILEKQKEQEKREKELQEQKARNKEIEKIEEKQQEEITSTKPIPKPTPKQETDTGITMEFEAPIKKEIQEPDISIKKYIAKYGKAEGFNIYMEVEKLNEIYKERTIQQALETMKIIESDGYYVVRM